MKSQFKLCFASAALLVGGCATSSVVDSTPAAGTTTAASLGEAKAYLPYFLPRTVLVATVKADSGGGSDKPAGAPTVNNTINIQNGQAKADEPGGKPQGQGGKDEKAACTQLKENYAKTRDAQILFVAGWGNELAKLDALGEPDKPTHAQKDAAAKAYDALVDKIASANQSVDEAKRLAEVFESVCPTKLTITVTAEVAPDPARRHFLLVRDAGFSSDRISGKVDDRGLLTAISTTADDKTGEALAAGVKSIATLVGAANPLGGAGVAASRVYPSALTSPPVGAFASVGPDPWILEFRNKIEELRQRPPAPLPPLGLVPPTHPLRFAISELIPEQQSVGGMLLGASGYGIHVSCSPPVGEMAPKSAPSGTPGQQGDPDPLIDRRQGVLISMPRACDVVAGKTTSAGDLTSYRDYQRSFVTVLDSRYAMRAPLERSRFVARTTSYEFADGRVSSVSYDKPSTAAAAWALPGTLVGSFFSGLVTGIQGPQSRMNAQANYLDAKAGLYKSEAALIEARAKAEAARDADAEPTAQDESSPSS